MDVLARMRNDFVAGLLLVAPLAVTLFVLQFAFRRTAAVLNPIVRTTRLTNFTGNIEVVAQLLAAVLLAAALVTVGDLASRSLGQRLFGGLERGVRLVPMVRTVYFGVRQVAESLTDRSARYESVVLVEFPREGLYSIGFVTNDSPREVRSVADDGAVNVFVPNSPNPTAGALVMLPADDVHEIDMSVRRGLRLLVTTGLSVEDVEELPEGVV